MLGKSSGRHCRREMQALGGSKSHGILKNSLIRRNGGHDIEIRRFFEAFLAEGGDDRQIGLGNGGERGTGFEDDFLVAFGAEIQGGRATEKATVIGTREGTFGVMAISRIGVTVPAILRHS